MPRAIELMRIEFGAGYWFHLWPSQTGFGTHKAKPRPCLLCETNDRPVVRMRARSTNTRVWPGRKGELHLAHSRHQNHGNCKVTADGYIVTEEWLRVRSRDLTLQSLSCREPDHLLIDRHRAS